MNSTEVKLCQQLEESLLRVWPSQTTMMLDGWALRCAGGYSGRANSASALRIGATLASAQLDQFEEHYKAAQLPPTVRLTPVADPRVEQLLQKRGYTASATSLTLIIALDQPFPFSENVGLATQPHDVWEQGVCRSQSGHKRHPDKLHAIVGQITVPRRFATLRENSKALAFGMCAIDKGWGEIGCVMVDAHVRGKGHGRTIMENLLAWATSAGAKNAYLQVDASNGPALKMYNNLGFETLYEYKTYCLE